jgi:hypothetical protein
LLVPAADVRPPPADWLGTSFGLTPGLADFWVKMGFAPLYVRQTPHEQTGAYTAMLLKELRAVPELKRCVDSHNSARSAGATRPFDERAQTPFASATRRRALQRPLWPEFLA